jgi:hypothetical protein
MGDRARELTFKAVEIAKRSGATFVAGLISPLEDCYSAELVPSQAEYETEHAELAQNLADAEEGMNCNREAVAATQASLNTV